MKEIKPTFVISVLLALLLMGTAVFADGKLYYIAPTQIPNVAREMKTAGFWISRVAKPDAVIMDAQAINAFNLRVRDALKLTKDIQKIRDPYDGRRLREELLSWFNDFKKKDYFDDNGKKAAGTIFEHMATQMALESIDDELKLKYGFITRYADQRFLPTDAGLYATANDIDFDELQNSALDVTTPVVILHRSADKKWLYVASELSDGWVKATKVVIREQPDFETYLASPSFVVITSPKADLYLDEELTQFYDHIRMGVKLPSVPTSRPDVYAANLAMRARGGEAEFKTVYFKKELASEGYLPYTPRTVLEQAFKMLNEPYGWGGKYGEQDCSRLLQEVFATVGIILPRDSKDQAQVGQSLAAFKEDEPLTRKAATLKKFPVGGVVLPMKGHIMLYLGTVNDRPYAIHSVWGYREPSDEGDIVRVINRIAVSDLYLGEGSQKGSLLKRMNAILSMSNP
jgi:hypothetical protein